MVGHAHAAQCFFGPAADLRAGQSSRLFQDEGYVLGNGERVEERPALKHVAERAGEVAVVREPAEVHLFAVVEHTSPVRRQYPGHYLEQHGLADAGRPKYHGGGAVRHLKVDPVQHDVAPEPLADILNPYHVLKKMSATTKSTSRMSTAESTTALVVARPTPCAPPWTLNP